MGAAPNGAVLLVTSSAKPAIRTLPCTLYGRTGTFRIFRPKQQKPLLAVLPRVATRTNVCYRFHITMLLVNYGGNVAAKTN